MRNELYHYGVLGMKWGVRRYQPYGSGGYTPKGKIVQDKSGKLSNDIYKTLSREEKQRIMARDDPPDEYTNKLERDAFLGKSFVLKIGNMPVASLDIWKEGDNDAAIAIMTRSGDDYRGKGYASKVASEGMKFVEEHGYENIYWDVRADNKGSIRLAEKSGFEQVPLEQVHNGDPNWLLYQKKRRK